MIRLNFNLRNPWSSRFENIKCWAGKTFFKNKCWEFELLKTTDILSLSFAFTVRQDHAGLDIEAGILGYCLHFNFYDNRHWDDDSNRWET